MHRAPVRFERVARVATALLLIASLIAFARGWWHSDMTAKIPWAPAGAHRALLLSGGYWLVVVAVLATGRRALPLKLVAVAALAIAAAIGPLPVLAVAYLFLSGTALGAGILTSGGRKQLASADLPLCAALGLGILAAVLAAFGPFPVHTALTHFLVLLLPVLWQGHRIVRAASVSLRATPAVGLRHLLLLGAIGNVAVLCVAMALMPDVGNDSLAFHLLVVEHVRAFRAWHFDVTRNLLAVVPMAVNFLYVAAVLTGGIAAAGLANVALLLALLGLVYTAVRDAGDRFAALLATLVAAASPLAFLESASLFVDNGLALFVVGALVALLRFARGGDTPYLVGGLMLLGAALSAKTLAAAAVPGALLLLALAWRERRAAFPWPAFALGAAAGLLLAAPPYLIAYVNTGNPVFPFMNSIFLSPHFTPFDFAIYPGTLDPRLPYRMTFYSDAYVEGLPGSFGFAVLLLLPALVVAAFVWARRDAAVLLACAFAYVLVVLAGVAYYLRYLYPALFLFAIAFGITLARLRARASGLHGACVGMAVLAACASLLFLPAAWAPGRTLDLTPLADEQAARAYVAAWAPHTRFVPILNALPDELGVAFFDAKPYFAGLTRPAYADTAYIRRFAGRTEKLRTSDDVATLVRDFDLGYFVLDSSATTEWVTLLRAEGTPLVTIDSATLYRVNATTRFPRELLLGDGMEVGPGRWQRHGEPQPGSATGSYRVNVDHVLWQRVAVRGGERHRYAVEARCAPRPAQLRLQVIWHAEDGSTTVSHKAVACTPAWREEETMFDAPVNAVAAVAFAIAHDKEWVEVRRVSLRSR